MDDPAEVPPCVRPSSPAGHEREPRESGYVGFLQSLPTFCPPTAPFVFAVVMAPLCFWFGVPWVMLPIGLLLAALAPQWDSCVFGLIDGVACLALIIGGAIPLVASVASLLR